METDRESFTVETTGSGQPDYSQPTLAPEALVVKFPEREVAGQRYNDSTIISFTATQTLYDIGTDANASKSGAWPTGIVAKDIQYYTEQGCYVRFNDADAQPNYIPPLLPLRFFSRVTKIYVYRATVDGTLYAWIEG